MSGLIIGMSICVNDIGLIQFSSKQNASSMNWNADIIYMNSYFFVLSFFASGLGLISAGPFSAVAMARLMGLGGFCEIVFETLKKGPIKKSRPGARRPLSWGVGGAFPGPMRGALPAARPATVLAPRGKKKSIGNSARRPQPRGGQAGALPRARGREIRKWPNSMDAGQTAA